MAIYRKSVVERRLAELEDFYLGLKKSLEGKEPDSLFAKGFGYSKEEFAKECTSVDFNEVLIRLEHFKAEITAIKLMKTKALKPSR